MSQWMDTLESDVQTTPLTVSSEALTSLPPEPELMEMVNIFFDNYFPMLPCISQKRFRDTTDFADQYSKSPLIWAVCAVVCAARSDIKSLSSQSLYLVRAKRLLDGNMDSKVMETWLPTTYIPIQPLESLQAAIWIAFCLFISAKFSEASIHLGNAYRYACHYGFHQIDAQRKICSNNIFAPKDAMEEEERRKVMWTLYLMDRQANCLTGIPMIIDDRFFVVNFPIDDEIFQGAEELDLAKILKDPFTRDLKALTARKPLSSISATIMRLIYTSTVLLGHIVDYHNTNAQLVTTPEAKAAGFRELENALTRSWLSIPVATIYDVPASDLDRFVLLMFNLHKCSILLHHSAPAEVSHPAAGSDPPGFLRCWGSVQTLLRIINQTAPLSIAPLLNPFLGAAYFLCGRFLTIRLVETQLTCYRSDLDLILMLLEKMGEKWPSLAEKWKRTIELDLAKDMGDVLAMKVGAGNYMESTYA
ncbi:hypothetical protein MMC27_005847 [Xylographa pallens]|nr:hypothetical protein [Xylographa pallens]